MPEKLFAVTDFNNVIPLRVVGVSEQDGFTVLTTEIDMEQPNEVDVYFHSKYYKNLFVTEIHFHGKYCKKPFISEKEPTGSSCVFFELEKAKEFAIKSLDEEMENKQRELDRLRERRAEVAAMGSDGELI